MAADVGIAVQLAKAGLHRFEGWEQLLEFEAARAEFGVAVQRAGVTVEAHVSVQLAAGHAEAQWLQAELAVVEHYVGIEVSERQAFALHDFLSGEFNVSVHHLPAIGLERLDRQFFIRGLFAVAAAFFLRGV